MSALRAEARAGGLAIAALLGGLAFEARAGVDLSPFLKCQTDKLSAAARYAACRLKAEGKALKSGGAPDFVKCDLQFGQKWQRTEARGQCLTRGDLAAVQGFSASYAGTVAGSLKELGEAVSCGSTFPECNGFCPAGEVCHQVRTCGSGFGSCGSDAECEPYGCLPSGCVCTSLEGAKQVFITSETYNGNLEGLLGADFRCQTLADRARLGGVYRAWLSDCQGFAASSAAARLTHGTALYVRTDGVVVALDWDDLTDGELVNPIDKDENGQPASITPIPPPPPPDDGLGACRPDDNVAVWTNTDKFGDALCTDCDAWTTSSSFGGDNGVLGLASVVDGSWTSWSGAGCGDDFHLYCIEQ